MEEKTPLSREVLCFQMLDFETSRPQNQNLRSGSEICGKMSSFSKNYVNTEGAISPNVLYYQQLSITRYQVSFYAKNQFEQLPVVSSAFNSKETKYKCYEWSPAAFRTERRSDLTCTCFSI